MLQSKTKNKMETEAMKDPPQKPKKTEKLTFQVKVDELVKLAQKKEAHLAVVLDVLNPPQKPKKTEKLTFQVKVDELVKLAQKKEAHLTVVLDVLKLIVVLDVLKLFALRVKADMLKFDKVEEDA